MYDNTSTQYRVRWLAADSKSLKVIKGILSSFRWFPHEQDVDGGEEVSYDLCTFNNIMEGENNGYPVRFNFSFRFCIYFLAIHAGHQPLPSSDYFLFYKVWFPCSVA